ncbi:penicillin-binding transpeptidase domain-containing protein [Fusibacter sp. JL216-2]|uniref:penicillin-binding transpeptidase domain-containing protein n=1 Tax=Fusibacter sp. JL216-2 TaxID=3071453 RepID=UPI003D34D1AD
MEPSVSSKRRLWFALFVVALIFSLLIGRLAYIQIVKGEEYKKLAMLQQTRNVPIPAKRGVIYDRKGIKLAFSVQSFTVWAHPKDIGAESVGEVASELAEILEEDKAKILDMISNSSSTIVRIKRWIPKAQADLIKNKRLKGVSVGADNKRIYPNLNFAAHILGHTTVDGVGLSGVELSYESELTGREGTLVTNTDAAGRQLPFGEEKLYPPEDGLSLVLTIDEIIQHFTEEALVKGVEDHNAEKITAIVMESKTGEILAMASKPDYDPNNPRDVHDHYPDVDFDTLSGEELSTLWNMTWKNPNLNDTYEPGSTFKIITTAISFEENVAGPHTKFSTPGYIDMYGSRIKNWDYPRSHKDFTLVYGMERSLNTMFMELADKVGKDTFYTYLENFGLTRKTGVDLPGEAGSIILPRNKIGPVELATISFGHGIAVTPLQMVNAINAIANDGKLMEPHIVKALKSSDGEVVERIEPKVIRNVISKKTSADVRLVLESVVENGSGKLAYIPGIRIGGKTGTSEKIVNGKYSDELAYASFVAIAPVDDPLITVLVVVDEPKDTNYGSQTAAPIAKDIMDDTLRYLGVEPEIPEYTREVKVPNLMGKPLSKAIKILEASGLSYTTEPVNILNNDSPVINQFPYPGSIASGQDIIILNVDPLPSDSNSE